MWTSIACEALRKKRCLKVSYDGYVRVVEVHACGFSKDENAIMRVFQVRGGSVSNEPVGWKLLRLDEAVAYAILEDEISQAPRREYRAGDRAMIRIIAQV